MKNTRFRRILAFLGGENFWTCGCKPSFHPQLKLDTHMTPGVVVEWFGSLDWLLGGPRSRPVTVSLCKSLINYSHRGFFKINRAYYLKDLLENCGNTLESPLIWLKADLTIDYSTGVEHQFALSGLQSINLKITFCSQNLASVSSWARCLSRCAAVSENLKVRLLSQVLER